MPIRIGDRVKVTNPHTTYYGLTGTVVDRPTERVASVELTTRGKPVPFAIKELQKK